MDPSSRSRRLCRQILVALPALALLSCTNAPGRGRYNLVIVSIDTLRADRVGAYGYERETTPRLDAFAARGALFEHVVAECSSTQPSHLTMLSGLYPSTHGVVQPSLLPGPHTRLLAQMLREAGYRTLGMTDGGYVDAQRGFSRGFEVFDDREKGLAAALGASLEAMAGYGEGERFFHFLHTYDVHCPYDPDPAFARMFRSADSQFVQTTGRCGNPDYNAMRLSSGQVELLSNRYDASIREADASLGAYLAELESRGRLQNTIVVVTSDHGEEFNEHGQIGHERSLYRELLLVPPSSSEARPSRSASPRLRGWWIWFPPCWSCSGCRFHRTSTDAASSPGWSPRRPRRSRRGSASWTGRDPSAR
jgi:arylsulfatase A-like enzyme